MQPDQNLIRKAVKLALDDLKDKHTGELLSAHALKVNFLLSLLSTLKFPAYWFSGDNYHTSSSLLLKLSYTLTLKKKKEFLQ